MLREFPHAEFARRSGLLFSRKPTQASPLDVLVEASRGRHVRTTEPDWPTGTGLPEAFGPLHAEACAGSGPSLLERLLRDQGPFPVRVITLPRLTHRPDGFSVRSSSLTAA